MSSTRPIKPKVFNRNKMLQIASPIISRKKRLDTSLQK